MYASQRTTTVLALLTHQEYLIPNTKDEIMVAPTLNLEKPVSLGASNDLGPDGSTDHYVVVSKIEEVKSRIDTAKAVAQAQHRSGKCY